jgi:hypothetical protein
VQSSSQPPRSVLEANVAGTGFNLNAGETVHLGEMGAESGVLYRRFLLSSRLTLDMGVLQAWQKWAVPNPEGLSH